MARERDLRNPIYSRKNELPEVYAPNVQIFSGASGKFEQL